MVLFKEEIQSAQQSMDECINLLKDELSVMVENNICIQSEIKEFKMEINQKFVLMKTEFVRKQTIVGDAVEKTRNEVKDINNQVKMQLNDIRNEMDQN